MIRFFNDERVHLLALTLVFGSLYLTGLEQFPINITGDEVHFLQIWLHGMAPLLQHPFELCEAWWHLPNGIWIIPYLISHLAGEPSLASLRFAHAFCGLLTILLAYLLYKLVLPPKWALGTASLLGTQHVMLVCSRFATIDSPQLVVLLAAFNLLIRAERRHNMLLALAGGAVAAISFYLNFPSRIIFLIWMAHVTWRKLFAYKNASLVLLAASVFGFLLVLAPGVPAMLNSPQDTVSYLRDRSIWFSEGRKLQCEQLFLPTEVDAVLVNVWNGLTVFNIKQLDGWGLYYNRLAGFVDPITGIILWIGIAALFVKRRVSDVESILLLTFFAYYLALAFFGNLAPVYGRAILMLPSVMFFVIEGIRATSRIIARHFDALTKTVPAALFGGILAFNTYYVYHYVDIGTRYGDSIAGVYRYVQRHPDDRFVFAHYRWVNRILASYRDDAWEADFIGTIMKVLEIPQQNYKVIDIHDLHSLQPDANTTLIISNYYWRRERRNIMQRWPRLRVQHLSSFNLAIRLNTAQ